MKNQIAPATEPIYLSEILQKTGNTRGADAPVIHIIVVVTATALALMRVG